MKVKDYLVCRAVMALRHAKSATVDEMRVFALDKSRKPRFSVSIQRQMPTLFGILDTMFATCEQFIEKEK